ncbi:hypothetical protein [Castellaniella sp.]|uniref:hypothetical protein n=1 Tax=Castellaniella sp. TaxID=1955812 RepID=UPI0025C187F1|nr:hypothetical protein [Castellaniella sp.]
MTISQRSTAHHTISPKILIAATFLLALWVLTHPYLGVIHDGRLYLLQSLHALDPSRWRDDLFFRYGSQDSFSLFSNGYKWLLAALGIAQANLLATLVGDALWLAGLGFLTCTLLKDPVERLAAIGAAIVLSAEYGGLGIFRYAEPFITPRLFSEAAVMGSLALAARRKYAMTSITGILAFVIHPLIALPGISIIAFEALRRDRRIWIIFGAVLIIGIAGAGLGIDPFSRATQFYTADWFRVTSTRNNFALISTWGLADQARLATVFIVLGTFLTVASNQERRYVTTILIVTFLSCTVSFLGADVAHNVLIMNLQLWRALWIAHLAANAALLLLLLRTGKTERVPIVIAAIFSFLPNFLSTLSTTEPFIVILCLSWFLHKKLRHDKARFLITITILILIAFAIALDLYSLYVQVTLDRHLGRHLLILTLATAAVLGAARCIRQRPGGWMITSAVGVLAVSLLLINQQTEWHRYVYGSGSDGGLTQFLDNSGDTYWEGFNGTEVLWFRARKPSYFSCVQGTESMFFRSTALDWSRRKTALQSLNTQDFSEMLCRPKAGIRANVPKSPAQIAAACQSLRDLDTIILNHPVPGLPNRSWTAPTYQEITEYEQRGNGPIQPKTVKISTFYRYDCSALR